MRNFGQSAAEIRRRLKRHEDMFLKRLFALLAKMAKADGRVDPWEVHAAELAFAVFPRAAKRRRFCVHAFNDGVRSRYSFHWLAYDFAAHWAGAEDCLRLYELLWEVACARDVVTPLQLDHLRSICRFLNLPGSYFDIFWRRWQGQVNVWDEAEEARKEAEARRRAQEEAEARRRRAQDRRQRQAPPPKPRNAYQVLACPADASDDTVRRAYRQAAKRNHPDLLRAKGCSEAEVAAATARMAEINSAWEEVKRERGL